MRLDGVCDFLARVSLLRDATPPRRQTRRRPRGSKPRARGVVSHFFRATPHHARDERLEARVRERAFASSDRARRHRSRSSSLGDERGPRVQETTPRSAMKRVLRAFRLHAFDRPDPRSFQPRVEDSIASEPRHRRRRGGDFGVFDRAPRLGLLRRDPPRVRRAMHDDGGGVRLRAFERTPATFRIHRRDGPRANRRASRLSASSFRHLRRGGVDGGGASKKRTRPPFKRRRQTRPSSVFSREVAPFASVPLDVRDVAPPSEREPSQGVASMSRGDPAKRVASSFPLGSRAPSDDAPPRRRLRREPNRRGCHTNRRDVRDPIPEPRIDAETTRVGVRAKRRETIGGEARRLVAPRQRRGANASPTRRFESRVRGGSSPRRDERETTPRVRDGSYRACIARSRETRDDERLDAPRRQDARGTLAANSRRERGTLGANVGRVRRPRRPRSRRVRDDATVPVRRGGFSFDSRGASMSIERDASPRDERRSRRREIGGAAKSSRRDGAAGSFAGDRRAPFGEDARLHRGVARGVQRLRETRGDPSAFGRDAPRAKQTGETSRAAETFGARAAYPSTPRGPHRVAPRG